MVAPVPAQEQPRDRAIGRRRLAQCGTLDFKLWKSAILEALDQHQVALLHAV